MVRGGVITPVKGSLRMEMWRRRLTPDSPARLVNSASVIAQRSEPEQGKTSGSM